MCNSKIMILDSRDRQNSSDSVTDYLVQLTKPMMNVSKVQLKEVCIPWTIYNISNAKGNNQMTLNEAVTGDFTITVPDGWYDISTLCSDLETLLDDGGTDNTYTVSYDASTMKVSITASTENIIIYGSDSSGKTTGFEQELGFTTATSPATIATGTNVPKILSPEYLLLNLDFVSDTIDTLDPNKNASFLITPSINGISANAGTVVRLTEGDTWVQESNQTNRLQHFRISLRDEDNNLVALNGADWQIVLQFHFCTCNIE